jgi:cytochrome P450
VISAADPELTGKKPLPEESVLGNIFFTLLAGHETLGSTLGFIFVSITLYPEYQKRIQEELDQHFDGRPKSEWTVEKDYQVLQKGYIGAVQKEVLYIYNPASFLMRTTVEPVTVVDSKGQSHMIPKNTLTLINNAAAARNPAVWKKPQVAPERRAALSDSPALYFNPERWLGTDDRLDDARGALPA